MAVPPALPRAMEHPLPPEVTVSPALSLTALPGDGGIRSRRIAILAADYVIGATIAAVQAALRDAGAVPVVIAPRIGAVNTSDGYSLHAEGSLENSPAVLFDAVVLPAGEAGVALLARHAQTQEFVTLQHRHGKTILALGSAQVLLDQAGVSNTLPSGADDPGIVRAARRDLDSALAAFIAAVGKHRHPEREANSPRSRRRATAACADAQTAVHG